ncbi:2-iminobutanoate/2-iminopropanoate deaminase [Bradyrhizobium sp. Rc3b]|uniref:RidA family protein n=1 Tax=Bradyrhizobium sp. Rc3b TaxID=1855322 RepID=UPI0008EC861E|nr:Rid family detoxifying hydrolase [Bradyrhizobium sp. Rc3b]SFN83182.1 2-iminobutanoate/2-iminopropanoate deaminase [Bradyrhizobium sp. Rc3b]
MGREAINAPGAAAVGPYSHGVIANGFVYLSGQTPIDSVTGRLVDGGTEAQVHQCFRNLLTALEGAGLSFDKVVKCNVFLTDMGDFASMNAVYAKHFSKPYPARTTIGVASLPLGARVEIEMVAATS